MNDMTDAKTGKIPEMQRPWPSPPGEEAYHGLAGEIVRCIEPQAEADSAALLLLLLAYWGSWVGRGPHAFAGDDRHGTNLYVCLVGDSSKGRKSTATNIISTLFSRANPDSTSPQIAQPVYLDGEGLIHAVRDPVVKQSTDEDGSTRNVVVDEGVTDKRLLVVAEGFDCVLKMAGGKTVDVVREAWDDGDITRTIKNNPSKATNTHISIIGHITPAALSKQIPSALAIGFGSRFLWVCSRRSKLIPRASRVQIPEEMQTRLRRSISSAQAGDGVPLKRDAEAVKLFAEFYHRHISAMGYPGLLSVITNRGAAQVLRLSLIYAGIDGAAEVRAEHVTAAVAVWEYCEASAKYICGYDRQPANAHR